TTAYREHLDPPARAPSRPRWRDTGLGIACGLAALLLLEVTPAHTHRALRMAASTQPEVAARGVAQLRFWGDDDILVAACHGRRHRALVASWLFGGAMPTPAQSQVVYYRVHGEPCPTRQFVGRGSAWFRGEPMDPEQGGDRIGGASETLVLTASRLDASIDGQAALGYAEWTLAWRNDHPSRDAEARALLELPPGGVVSRATLWIDGEEREAAFGGRSAVKQAYRRVVQRQRDPLLVTSAGPDRALVQCFPIVAAGGTMKIRVGVTFPLTVEDDERATAPYPRLLAANFVVSGEPEARTVWLESKHPIEGAHRDRDGVHRLRRSGADPFAKEAFVARRSTPGLRAFAPDPFLEPGADVERRWVAQWLDPVPIARPGRVVVAVDTSAALGPHVEALATALRELPTGIEAGLVLGADAPNEIVVVEPEPMSAGLLERWQQALDRATWEGGRDNVPLLSRAWDVAVGQRGGIVVWLHAAQPLAMASAESLRQRWDREQDGPVVWHLQAGAGDDQVLAELWDAPRLHAIPRHGPPVDDLSRHLATWAPGAVAHLRRFGHTDEPAGHRTSDHLARLWAADETEARRRRGETDEATDLAMRYQLVTPVTGAVVLESAGQYDEAGLQPVDPESVPTVPEPETWALLIVAFGVLLLAARRLRPGVSGSPA
ncbi:MAG: hypothetical protein RIF41_05780, partial [Polyangiaceae bacterium]